MRRITIIAGVIMAVILIMANAVFGETDMNDKAHRADWLKEAKWGVFTHYLTGVDATAEYWNEIVDSFDVNALANQLESVGAKYYFVTIGQNSGHYCSPNAAYDKYVGVTPSKCSKRDLVADLYDALQPKGIKLLVYISNGAPAADKTAVEKLKWEWGYEGGWPVFYTKRTGKRLVEFQRMWEDVLREWSLRWGKKICGWWIDGCYFSDEMYRHPDAPNFQSFTDALRAGNPDSIVAFNPGLLTPVITLTELEDYTAGEVADAFPVCTGPKVGNAQYHILSYLGAQWGQGKPRFADEFVVGYTKDVNDKGGVVTWDVPISTDGKIPQEYINQLKKLK